MYLMYMLQKKIKCKNPFPNWKPITKISYIELDIIVSRLFFPLDITSKFIPEDIIEECGLNVTDEDQTIQRVKILIYFQVTLATLVYEVRTLK